nr:hypothetical protein [Tanacetum cinerariifolium]
MEVDIEEDENEPELTYPYEEVDPLNPLPPTFESELKDVMKVENTIEHEDETVPASVYELGESSTNPFIQEDNNGLFPGLMGTDINSLFVRMASLSRRLCGRQTTHALVEKKGKAKDKYYGKLILDLGNEVRSSVEQRTDIMEKLVEKLVSAEDKVECKELKKELEEPMFSKTFLRMQNERESVDDAIVAKRARQVNARNDARGSRPVKGNDAAPAVRECTFAGFMKCNPTAFHGTALTWWNAKIATMGLETMNQMPWTEMKQLMTRFNELALMCSRMVKPERVKVNAYIWGLTDNIKGEVTSSKPANMNEDMLMAYKLMEQKSQARDERILEGKKRKLERFQSRNRGGKSNHKDNSCQTFQNNQKQRNAMVRHKARYCKEKNVATGANALPIPTCYDCGEQGHTRNRYTKKVKQEEVREVRGRAYAIKDAQSKGPNVVTARYEVELADRRVVSTNTILKGCTLNLVNYIFEINLMPIELGTFDVIIIMDWLLKHDAVIVCGEKVVRVPYGNKMLIVQSDKGVSRLKVISCIKVPKYVKRGCHFLLAHVTEKKSKEKRLEDVPVIRDFLEVFMEELLGLPPSRQVEFQIDLVPGVM